MTPVKHTNYLIIGGGIIGMAIARELKRREPQALITIIEKEPHVAEHGSGRNSGVLHAGFYYTADSLKAKFCREGNAAWKQFVTERGLKMNPCEKVVVATNEEEWQGVHELKRRGDANGVQVSIVDQKRLDDIDPNAKTHKEALYSPTTATIDPVELCHRFAQELKADGVEILVSHPYRERTGEREVLAGGIRINATTKVFNCAGLYADKVAKDFGFCKDYVIIPFKGVNLKTSKPNNQVRTLIYPVPNLKNPFLGVHFNITVTGELKIGPTAIPAFWRENYTGLDRFKLDELLAIAGWETKLFLTNAFNFRSLAFEEIRKYQRSHLINLVRPMVKHLDESVFDAWARPGIRAQLLHKTSLKLLQDFVVEGDANSVHVLNAVSPAFTCSLPFGQWVVETYGA